MPAACRPQAGRPPALHWHLRSPRVCSGRAAGPVRLKELAPKGRFAPGGGGGRGWAWGRDRGYVSACLGLRRAGCCLPGLREVGPSRGSRTRPPTDQGCPPRPLCPSLGPAPGLHAPSFPCPWVSDPSGCRAGVCTLTCESSQQADTVHAAVCPLTTRLGPAGQLLAQLSVP